MKRTKYLPFGGTRTGSVSTDKKFTGQRLDSTGLYYYNARYYDPLIGRFISPDTFVSDISNPQDFNLYTYVLNNPLKYNDPTGHCPWLFGAIFGGISYLASNVIVNAVQGRDLDYGLNWGDAIQAMVIGAITGGIGGSTVVKDIVDMGTKIAVSSAIGAGGAAMNFFCDSVFEDEANAEDLPMYLTLGTVTGKAFGVMQPLEGALGKAAVSGSLNTVNGVAKGLAMEYSAEPEPPAPSGSTAYGGYEAAYEAATEAYYNGEMDPDEYWRRLAEGDF